MAEMKMIMENIELYRKEKGYTIKEFVSGIVSERNYRRYKYNEQPIPFNIFSQLIQKLELELTSFFSISFTELRLKNINVLYTFSLSNSSAIFLI